MVGSFWSVEAEPRPFGGKEFQSFRTDRGITFCLWPACRGGLVPVPGGSLPRSRSGRPVEPVNPRAGCPGPGPRTEHRRLRRRWPAAAPANGYDFRPLYWRSRPGADPGYRPGGGRVRRAPRSV